MGADSFPDSLWKVLFVRGTRPVHVNRLCCEQQCPHDEQQVDTTFNSLCSVARVAISVLSRVLLVDLVERNNLPSKEKRNSQSNSEKSSFRHSKSESGISLPILYILNLKYTEWSNPLGQGMNAHLR